MGRGLVFVESDAGTKERAKLAYARVDKELAKEFKLACRKYWQKVWETARALCHEMAYDTGALYSSIRLLWDIGGLGPEPYGGLYEVAVSSQGVEITAMIKVGGTAAINPRTGWFVDYAAAVHDGTKYMRERPFLTIAITQCEPYREAIFKQHIDRALSKFEREY